LEYRCHPPARPSTPRAGLETRGPERKFPGRATTQLPAAEPRRVEEAPSAQPGSPRLRAPGLGELADELCAVARAAMEQTSVGVRVRSDGLEEMDAPAPSDIRERRRA
jgi:hypothetical protein